MSDLQNMKFEYVEEICPWEYRCKISCCWKCKTVSAFRWNVSLY